MVNKQTKLDRYIDFYRGLEESRALTDDEDIFAIVSMNCVTNETAALEREYADEFISLVDAAKINKLAADFVGRNAGFVVGAHDSHGLFSGIDLFDSAAVC